MKAKKVLSGALAAILLTLTLPKSRRRLIWGCCCAGLSATPAQGGAEPRTRTLGGVRGGLPPRARAAACRQAAGAERP